ncbi:MAG TPA: trypsin-like peptidase domain-containing protein [Anaeromyxobacter sp.]|nr:trypsin-like peptidase domain-containing protein [Anaeromyxobacter sp.]
MPPGLLAELSGHLQGLVSRASAQVVRVEGGRRFPSSGVVFSSDGVIVTTHHTLERDEGVTVGLPSGESVAAEVLGRDPSTDLAALRVEATGLEPARFGEETLVAAGALVVGLSRPGKSARASLGLVARAAGEYRARRGGRIDRYLETTLDLHPGFSGSLVLGAEGEGLGLATSGLLRGTAMAVPPTTLRRVVKSLLAHGEVRRGYLGLATHPVPLPPEVREKTGEELALLVSRVEPDSPAARAGIVLGDALLSFGGESLQDPGELFALLAEDRIGDTIAMKILRAGEVKVVEVTIGTRERRV